jgi:sarcosine/dimethylglycine N-methyltransferase
VTILQVNSQYTSGLSKQNIESALIAAGKDLHHLQPADLGPLEDFHTLGRIATMQLAELAGISSADSVLDAGTGIGGTARFLADQFGCHVTAIDLTQEYCDTAVWLNRIVGLDDLISVHNGDVTDLPFADAQFDVVTSQHVQMNVADKARLYEEARRVLMGSGRLAIWDVTAISDSEPEYPVPWANTSALSHLVSPDRLAKTIEAAGFSIDNWNDLTADAAPFMESLLALAPNPLGLHAFVPDFLEKVTNLARGLSDGRLRVLQGVARAV